MRIAIVGSRNYANPELVRAFVKGLCEKDPGTVIVSGGARGVDTWAEEAAVECGLETSIFLADWDQYGKTAGFLRNSQIVGDCDKAVAFWDLVSRGTMDTVRKVVKEGKVIKIIGPAGETVPLPR